MNVSSNGISTRVRVGFPSKDGAFNGLAFDSNISLSAIVLGGAIAVSIVWLSVRGAKPPADELEAPTKLAVTRGA